MRKKQLEWDNEERERDQHLLLYFLEILKFWGHDKRENLKFFQHVSPCVQILLVGGSTSNYDVEPLIYYTISSWI